MKIFRRSRSARRATTVVETAVMAPLMLLMMLGFLEFGYWFLLKQTVSLAANRAARTALTLSNDPNAWTAPEVKDVAEVTPQNQ